MKMIIALVGEIGSGKGAVAEHIIKKYNASYHKFSDILKEICERLYLSISRDNLISISEILRNRFGEDLLANAMAEDVKKDNSNIVIVDGVRRMADIKHLKKIKGFHLVRIIADAKTRYERIKNRGEKIDEQNLTFEQFTENSKRETEVSIADVASRAEFTVANNKTINELHEKIENLIEKIQSL